VFDFVALAVYHHGHTFPGLITARRRVDMPNTCPHCGTAYPSDTVICVKCGVDMRSGEELHTEADPVPRPPLAARVLLFFANLVPGFFRLKILIVALLACAIGVGVVLLGMHIFLMGAVFGGVAIMAAGLVVHAQAVGWILFGTFALLPECLAELDSNQWLVFILLVFGPIAVFLTRVLSTAG
jgi:hypothetical protein